MDINISSQIVVQTAAQWAVDATVYSAKRILVTSDAYYGSTDQRKFKIADGTQTWAQLDYFPLDTALALTLAQVLTNGLTTGEQSITSDNAKSTLQVFNDYIYQLYDNTYPQYGDFAINDAQTSLSHGIKIRFDAPAIYLAQATASRIVETDASKNLTYVAKGTAYNKNFGTGSGEVCEGNDTRVVKSSFDVSFDGQGGVITVGANAIKRALANGGTITGFSLKGDVSGSIEIDMLKNGVSMVGAGNKIDLVSQSSDTGSPTSWTTTTIAADDELEWSITSATTITKLWLTIKYDKTS